MCHFISFNCLYLFVRSFSVRLGDIMSSSLCFSCGVSQGSILGAHSIFSICTSSSIHIILGSIAFIFASETSEFYGAAPVVPKGN